MRLAAARLFRGTASAPGPVARRGLCNKMCRQDSKGVETLVKLQSSTQKGCGMPDSHSDNELLVAARRDPAAFRLFYDRWVEKLLRYFYRRTFDAEASADLVAETFAVAWIKRSTFRDIDHPAGAWLYGIARRELVKYRRRWRADMSIVQRLKISIPRLTADEISEIENAVDAAAFRSDLIVALERLNDRDRQPVVLRVIDGLAFREVASSLGCSEGAARVRV